MKHYKYGNSSGFSMGDMCFKNLLCKLRLVCNAVLNLIFITVVKRTLTSSARSCASCHAQRNGKFPLLNPFAVCENFALTVLGCS